MDAVLVNVVGMDANNFRRTAAETPREKHPTHAGEETVLPAKPRKEPRLGRLLKGWKVRTPWYGVAKILFLSARKSPRLINRAISSHLLPRGE